MLRRVTANIPVKLLTAAEEVTGKGITATLVEGLKLLKRQKAYDKAIKLKGKIDIDLDLGVSRERTHR